MEAVIVLLGTVLGACIGLLFTYVTNRQEHSRRRQEFKRDLMIEKHEEIHADLSECVKWSSEVSMLMLGEIGFNKKFNPKDLSTSMAHSKLGMHVKFYAPELMLEHEQIRAQMNIIAKAAGKLLLKGVATKEEDKQLVATAVAACKIIEKNAEEAQDKLAVLVKKQIEI